jgi:hypothetical protein
MFLKIPAVLGISRFFKWFQEFSGVLGIFKRFWNFQ